MLEIHDTRTAAAAAALAAAGAAGPPPALAYFRFVKLIQLATFGISKTKQKNKKIFYD